MQVWNTVMLKESKSPIVSCKYDLKQNKNTHAHKRPLKQTWSLNLGTSTHASPYHNGICPLDSSSSSSVTKHIIFGRTIELSYSIKIHSLSKSTNACNMHTHTYTLAVPMIRHYSSINVPLDWWEKITFTCKFFIISCPCVYCTREWIHSYRHNKWED